MDTQPTLESSYILECITKIPPNGSIQQDAKYEFFKHLINLYITIKDQIKQKKVVNDHMGVLKLALERHDYGSEIFKIFMYLHLSHSEKSVYDFIDTFKNDELPVYLIPYKPPENNATSCVWNKRLKTYGISILITKDQKELQSTLTEYGYDTIQNAHKNLDQAGLYMYNGITGNRII